MGTLDEISSLLRRRVAVRRRDHTVAGAAGDVIGPLVRSIKALGPRETRSGATDHAFEGVFATEQVDACCAILEAGLGEPAKPFGRRANFEDDLEALVDSRGGIQREQCLYLRCHEADGRVAFAALWPWSDGESVTLKVGVYD